MKILLMGKHSDLLSSLLDGHSVESTDSRLNPDLVQATQPDLLVSFGYRFILTPEILRTPTFGAINIHISLLPWNRGSDPNFWSWLENTPKGVTIHQMTENLDQGPILAQKELYLDADLTLSESYHRLIETGVELFPKALDRARSGLGHQHQEGPGTYHRSLDLARYSFLLEEQGWDTPCAVVNEFGRTEGLWQA